jgi:hypothetical protein
MAILAKVYRNGISATAPDAMGARAVTIEAAPAPCFTGTLGKAAAYLERLPIGQSVEVRYYRNGKFAGLRSCMNKPALWDSLRDGARRRSIPSIRAAA